MELTEYCRHKLLRFLEFFMPVRKYLSSISLGFRLSWKHYIYQSLIAAIVILIVFLILTESHAVIIASIGSTAFIIFATPRSITAEPRRVIGGHLIGIASGSLFSFIPQLPPIPSAIIYSIAIGISIFLMVATNTEHPPASGTALGIAMNGFTINVTLAVIASAIVLSVAHYFLKRFLKDLT